MAKILIEEDSLISIADAIRGKTGDSAPLTVPDGMVTAIQNITGTGQAQYVNLLTDSRCTVYLNKTIEGDSIVDGNGRVVVAVPVGLINPVPYDGGYQATFRWRGLFADAFNGQMIYNGYDGAITTFKTYLANQISVDEYGDFTSPSLIYYSDMGYVNDTKVYAFILLCRKANDAITQADIDHCIMTVNQPIGRA